MARKHPDEDGLREAPLPGLSPAPPEGGAVRARRAGSAAQRAGLEVPDHAEHRKRLRARFMQGGPEAMPDYELLELVLFRAIPRRDVKPLAKRLLRAFGGFDDVISAPPARLAEVQGAGEAVVQELKIVESAAHRLVQARVMGRDAIQSWAQLLDYCRARLAREPTEQFRILFLDRKNMLIADEAQGRGTVDHVPVYPREVVKRALELSASALILVHNHPSGDPAPSRADVEMTHRIMEACAAVGLAVHDHVIVGKREVASFHEMGLMDS
jgi:DNA repair protein RadC